MARSEEPQIIHKEVTTLCTKYTVGTYKGLRFLGVVQQLFGDWISNQLTKLVCCISRNLHMKTEKNKNK